MRVEHGEVLRADDDLKAAFAAVDAEALQRVDAFFHVHRQRGFRAEGRGTAEEVARPFARLCRRGRFDVLHAELAREVARRDFAVAVHEDDEAVFGLVRQHDGLDDLVFVEAQFGGGLRGAAVFFIGKNVRLVGDVMLAQKADGRGDGVFFFAHGVNDCGG